jgi:hypothetical protein
MPGRANHFDQMAAMTKIIEIAPQALALKAHVRQIVDSSAFRNSRRSQEFLRFIVDRALDGHFDELKERSLGVELFGRAPSYDTGGDSIVRVTARDVRKRLSQFYAESGFDSGFRVELPPGSYIPEFRKVNAFPTDVATPVLETPATIQRKSVLRIGIALLLAIAAAGLAVQFWNERSSIAASHALPWSVLSQPNRQIHVIFCDPDIVNIQRLLNFSISLSDYANQRYWPKSELQNPETQHILLAASFRGANVAAVDAGIALKILGLSGLGPKFTMDTRTARSVRLADFKTDDSFVLLGSPRSNPWVELFQDQLDFRFEFDGVRKAEFLRNKHPRAGEASIYVPTAEGWDTGQAYAIVALVDNPNQGGQVLLLAGSNAEATEAAGKLATNQALLAQTLRSHGIDPHGQRRHFEVLLRVSTMAGSPNTFEVIACHVLAGKIG